MSRAATRAVRRTETGNENLGIRQPRKSLAPGAFQRLDPERVTKASYHGFSPQEIDMPALWAVAMGVPEQSRFKTAAAMRAAKVEIMTRFKQKLSQPAHANLTAGSER